MAAAVCFVSPLILPVEDVPMMCCVEGKHQNLGFLIKPLLSTGWESTPMHEKWKEVDLKLTAFDRSDEVESGSKFLIVVTDYSEPKRSWDDLLFTLCNEFNLLAESFGSDRSYFPEFVPVLDMNQEAPRYMASYLDMESIATFTMVQWERAFWYHDQEWDTRVERLVNLVYPSQHVDRLAFFDMAWELQQKRSAEYVEIQEFLAWEPYGYHDEWYE